MRSRELVRNTIEFKGVDRLAHEFPEPYGNDFYWLDMTPSPDDRYSSGTDDWGVHWHNAGQGAYLDHTSGHVLEDWSRLKDLKIPDVKESRRWVNYEGARERAGDKYLLAHGFSIYERIHILRGMENTWMDIYDNRENLCRLMDLIVDMNLYAIERCAKAGVDGIISNDDWGLQDRLMIPPQAWRELWKPRYARMFKAARAAGLNTFLHSCGHIVEILDDLIEVGLQVIHMDQQENMGLELLGERFGGRLTFFSPVDIQKTMVNGTPDQIRAYCRKMVQCLFRENGGFIPRKYFDHKGAGHTPLAITTMCEEFLKISGERFPSAPARSS